MGERRMAKPTPPPPPPLPYNADGGYTSGGDWAHGICGCTSAKECGFTCCFGMICCTPCLEADIAAKSNTGMGKIIWPSDSEHDKQQRESYDCGLTFCALCCMVVPCQDVIVNFLLRRAVIKKYGMVDEGDITSGFLSYCCCTQGCAKCQQMNEIVVRENYTYSSCCTVVPTASQGQV